MIILCGCTEKEESIITALSRYTNVVCFSSEEITYLTAGHRTCVWVGKYQHIPKLKNGMKGILLLGSRIQPQEKNKIPSGFITVFDANNRNAAELLMGTGGIAVSCGSSARDSVSLASRDTESCVVSLQRSVRNLMDLAVEPRDIPMRLCGERSLFEILSFCALMLLSGLEYGEKMVF